MTERAEAERLAGIREFVSPADTATDRVFLLQQIDARDATIARLQKERDAATREAETFRGQTDQLGELIAARDARIGDLLREAEALREEVERLRSEGKQLAMPRRERVPFVLDEASAQPSADDVERSPSVVDFCRQWRNNAWGDERFAEFCRGIEALRTAARAQDVREGIKMGKQMTETARAQGRAEMREIDEPVIEAARKVLAQYEAHELVDAEAELATAIRSLPDAAP